MKQAQICNNFKENDSGAKLYITSNFVTLWSLLSMSSMPCNKKHVKENPNVFAWRSFRHNLSINSAINLAACVYESQLKPIGLIFKKVKIIFLEEPY